MSRKTLQFQEKTIVKQQNILISTAKSGESSAKKGNVPESTTIPGEKDLQAAKHPYLGCRMGRKGTSGM